MSNHLAEEILIEIFIRLPWKSLIRLRCVSRSICALLGSQDFINSHYYFNNTKNNMSILVSESVCKRMFSIDYKSIASLSSSSSHTVLECEDFIDWMDYPSLSQDCVIKFLGSCKGLLCIYCSRYHTNPCFTFDDEICFHIDLGKCCHGQEIHLWNPSTKQYKKLPTLPQRPDRDSFIEFDFYGFGYDYKFDDYKLVRFVDDDDGYDLDVYSLKSNSWKTIQNIPYSASKNCPEGVLVNGALHWFATTKGQDSEVLISFDIVLERFEEVALPQERIPNPKTDPGISLEDDTPTCDLDVVVLGGCLCLLFHVFNVRADVWVMQDYGVKESWTKRFSITQEALIRNSDLVLLGSFKNNEILVRANGRLWLFNPNMNTYKKLKFHNSTKHSTKQLVSVSYMASVVSLN